MFETTIHSNIKNICEIVTDNERFYWRSDISEIRIIELKHTFIEISKSGIQTVFSITVMQPYHLYEFDMENKYLRGHWIGRFYEISEQETKIAFMEILKFKNPIIMIFSYMFMNLKAMQEKYISDLINALEKWKLLYYKRQ